MDQELFTFAQQEQAKRVVQIRIGQEHRLNGRATGREGGWLQRLKGFDLRANIGRCVQKKPSLIIHADRD